MRAEFKVYIIELFLASGGKSESDRNVGAVAARAYGERILFDVRYVFREDRQCSLFEGIVCFSHHFYGEFAGELE